MKPLAQVAARELARLCWVDSQQNGDVAEELFRQRNDDLDGICYALELYQHWIDKRILSPLFFMQGDEPRAFESD